MGFCLRILMAMLLAVALGVPASAAPVRSTPAKPAPDRHPEFAPPPTIEVTPLPSGTTVKPIAFTKAATLIPTGVPWALVSDAACGDTQLKTWTGHAIGLGSATDLKRVFQQEAEAAGFQVTGGPADLFQTGRRGTRKAANLKVGALVTGLRLKLCAAPRAKGARSAAVTGKGAMAMDVDWQVFSKSTGEVVARITTQGGARLATMTPAAGATLRQAAFAQNTRALFAAEPFRALVLGTAEEADPKPDKPPRRARLRRMGASYP